MDFDVMLHELGEKRSWPFLYVEDEDLYRFQLETPGNRRQDVYVNFRRDVAGEWVATIWSVIAEVEDFNFSDPQYLLGFNWRSLYGNIAIRKDQVVLLHNQLAEGASWEGVERAIQSIAMVADTIEKDIYGDQDDN